MSIADLLDAAEIKKRLHSGLRCAEIIVKESVSSTNTVLKELAEQGASEGTVIIAEQQSTGKGRLGRRFHSPKGTGLYMSILLRPKFSAEESLSITTAAAAAVASAIESVTGRKALIKWVNDIYVDGYKVCGILTEASVNFKTNGLDYAILGIGVNIKEPEGGFSDDIKDIAGALYKQQPPMNTRNTLTAEILNRFFDYYNVISDRTFMNEYKKRSLLDGMKIHFVRGEEKYFGTVLGVDDSARLLVDTSSGIATFSAGEVAIEKDFLRQVRKQKGER